jgi:hypothetical protein
MKRSQRVPRGVITLESLGLVIDAFKRELRPMKLRLG